jgi:hypothetical protein
MKNIHENEFAGAPGGTAGSIGYGATYGTMGGGDITQDPSSFNSSHRNETPGDKGNTTSQLHDSGSDARNLDQLFAKRETPSPDEVISGIKYEMGQQMVKNKAEAKQIVRNNLAKDPKFYSGLKMLGITDADMVNNMTEERHPNDAPAHSKVTSNIEETKRIFAEMIKERGEKYVVNAQISDVMKDMWAAKQARRLS